MELWIRSQDKTTLIRSYEIYIAEYGKGSYVIRAKRTSHILGAYNSFKRALEVLDEIQEHIKKQGQSYILTDEKGLPAGLRNYGNIYEMPKE